jgi:CheY-like chemotaxis protein
MDQSKVRHLAIFLVEDEAFIRMMIAEMVEDLGHPVVAEASRIDEAQRLAQTAEFDLALLDVNIGGHGIAPIAECIQRRGLPFLLVSGYGSESLPEPFSGRSVLQKPFVVSKLKDAIEAILDH